MTSLETNETIREQTIIKDITKNWTHMGSAHLTHNVDEQQQTDTRVSSAKSQEKHQASKNLETRYRRYETGEQRMLAVEMCLM